MSQWGKPAEFELKDASEKTVLAAIRVVPLVGAEVFASGLRPSNKVVDILVTRATGDDDSRAKLVADVTRRYVGKTYQHWLERKK